MIDGNVCEKYLRCSREEQMRVASIMGATANELKREILDMNDLSLVCTNTELNRSYIMKKLLLVP